jgi:hypothetical protein
MIHSIYYGFVFRTIKIPAFGWRGGDYTTEKLETDLMNQPGKMKVTVLTPNIL